MDMVQLLYTRLPTFTENQKPLLKKLKMRSLAGDKTKRKSKVFTAHQRSLRFYLKKYYNKKISKLFP